MSILKDQEQAIYTSPPAPLDLTEIISTYKALLAGDNLPERVAVQIVVLQTLLDAADANTSEDWSCTTATDHESKVRSKEGSALFLVERNSSMQIIAVWAGITGRDEIKPDTFYTLKNGKPVETE